MNYKQILNVMIVVSLTAMTVGFSSCKKDESLTKEEISEAIKEGLNGNSEEKIEDSSLIGTWKATLHSEDNVYNGDDEDGNPIYVKKTVTQKYTFEADKTFEMTITTITGDEAEVSDQKGTFYITKESGRNYLMLLEKEDENADVYTTNGLHYEMLDGKLKLEYHGLRKIGYGGSYIIYTKQ